MRGGRRENAGRKPGVKSTKSVERMKKVEAVMAAVNAAVPGAFEGDAHAFLITVYKDPEMTLKDRIACAVAAAPFEKPKLAAVEHSGEMKMTYEDKLAALERELNGADEHAH